MTARRCPDCNGDAVGPHIKHHDTCPLWVGLMAAHDDDERALGWLPLGTARTRPTTPAERTELRLLGRAPDPDLTVTRVAPGRHFIRYTSGFTLLLAVRS